MFLTNLVPTAIVASAVAPALLLLWLAVAADSRPEPPRVVLTAVAFGAVAALVIGVKRVADATIRRGIFP